MCTNLEWCKLRQRGEYELNPKSGRPVSPPCDQLLNEKQRKRISWSWRRQMKTVICCCFFCYPSVKLTIHSHHQNQTFRYISSGFLCFSFSAVCLILNKQTKESVCYNKQVCFRLKSNGKETLQLQIDWGGVSCFHKQLLLQIGRRLRQIYCHFWHLAV